MKWLYYVPHVWESPSDRTVWEDVYIMLADSLRDRSIWLTVAGLDSWIEGVDDPAYYETEGDARRRRNFQLLDGHICYISPVQSMLVDAKDFDLEELLDWTRLYICLTFNDPAPELVPGTHDDFAGSNRHAKITGTIARMLAVPSGSDNN
jgi:hypothetical protein